MSPPAVVFDLDGTLIDSAPAIHAVSNAVLAGFGLAPLSLDQVRSFVGRGVPHLVRELLAASGEDPQGPLFGPVEAALLARYETDLEGNSPYPGVAAALSRLAAAGCRMAVCTNKPQRPAEAALAHVGLAGFFDHVIGGDSVPARKPDPMMIAMSRARLGAGRLVYVGDSEIDAETARNAAVPFVLHTEGYRRTPLSGLDHCAAFADFALLPDIIARLAG